MKEINGGDTVQVDFNNVQITLCRRAKVLGIPRVTGDSWIVEDCETGLVHYISEGCTITKIASA